MGLTFKLIYAILAMLSEFQKPVDLGGKVPSRTVPSKGERRWTRTMTSTMWSIQLLRCWRWWASCSFSPGWRISDRWRPSDTSSVRWRWLRPSPTASRRRAGWANSPLSESPSGSASPRWTSHKPLGLLRGNSDEPNHPTSPSQNAILLGALTFSKIEIFIKMFYYLGIRFANSWIECRQRKTWNCQRCGSAAFPNFRGGNSSPPTAAKCVRTIFRILHQNGTQRFFGSRNVGRAKRVPHFGF